MKNPIENPTNRFRIDNSRFMELVDEIATEMTEMMFGDDTTIEVQDGLSDGIAIIFTDEAQDYYNDKYDEIEERFNKYRIYSM